MLSSSINIEKNNLKKSFHIKSEPAACLSIRNDQTKLVGQGVTPYTVRIYSYVMSFISKCRRGRRMVGRLLCESRLTFSVFLSQPSLGVKGLGIQGIEHVMMMERAPEEIQTEGLVSMFSANLSAVQAYQDTQVYRNDVNPMMSDRYINMALLYLFRKGTEEVKEFNSAAVVRKHMLEMDGVLVSKNRLVDGLDYLYTGELNVDLGSLGIKLHAPVLDRFSPLAWKLRIEYP